LAGYQTVTDSNGNIIGYVGKQGKFMDNRSYDYMLRQKDATHIGQQEGQMAKHLSMNETYYHASNNMFYAIPTGSITVVNSAGEFVGY
jgi:hypothetical protein